jgi:ABC-type multidrug transport system ATPase subunit
MNTYAIRTESLSRRFGAVQAVDKLSFEVPAGTVFGFLGPNGAGKTTGISMPPDRLHRFQAGGYGDDHLLILKSQPC